MAAPTRPGQPPQLVEALPEYLADYVTDDDFEEYGVPTSVPIGRVSIEGKLFTALYGGEEFPFTDAEGYHANRHNFVIVKAYKNKPHLASRKFYHTGFERGSKAPPDCASLDGIAPDPSCPDIQGGPLGRADPGQAPMCSRCKWSRYGTAIGPDGRPGKGQRCQQYKRLAVLPSGDMVNEVCGGPMLLAIPPTSFQAFDEYYEAQKRMGRPLHFINTRFSFESVPHAQLKFEFESLIYEDERDLILGWRDPTTEGGEYVDRLLRIEPAGETSSDPNISYTDPVQEAAPQPASPPAPAPAPPRAATPQPAPVSRATPKPAARPAPAPAQTQAAPTRPATGGVAGGQPRPQPRLAASTEAPIQPATRATQAPTAVRARQQAPVPNQPPAPQARQRPAPVPTQTNSTQTNLSGVQPNGQAGRPVPRARPPAAPPATAPAHDVQYIEEGDYGEVDQIISDLGESDFNIPT